MYFNLIFSTAFIVVGLIFILVSLIQRKNAKKAEEWPTIPGVVLSTGLQEQHSYDSDSGSSTTYKPVVQYQYSIMGQKYNGDRVTFGSVSYDYNTAAKKIAAYPQGASVIVHYDPNDPSKAVLEAKSASGWIFLVLGVIFVVTGILAAIFLPMLQK